MLTKNNIKLDMKYTKNVNIFYPKLKDIKIKLEIHV